MLDIETYRNGMPIVPTNDNGYECSRVFVIDLPHHETKLAMIE